jgi:hypothetical protein
VIDVEDGHSIDTVAVVIGWRCLELNEVPFVAVVLLSFEGIEVIEGLCYSLFYLSI